MQVAHFDFLRFLHISQTSEKQGCFAQESPGLEVDVQICACFLAKMMLNYLQRIWKYLNTFGEPYGETKGGLCV